MKDEIYLEYTTDTGLVITVLVLKIGHYFEAARKGLSPEEMTEFLIKKLILVDGKELTNDNTFNDVERAMEVVSSQFIKLKQL